MKGLGVMRTTAFLAAFLFLVSAVGADEAPDAQKNWPRWRGPLGTGWSPTAEPPLKWDSKTNIRWKTRIPGKGSSTPVVWGDRVFVLSAEDTGVQAAPGDIPKPNPAFQKRTEAPRTYHRFLALCLDRATGKVLWQKVAARAVPHEGHHPSHSYGGFSPVTDGKRLYAWFGSQGLYCYDLAGKLLWKQALGRMETRLGWGEAGSPAVHNGVLVIDWDHEGKDFLLALHAETGKTIWKVDRDEPTSWATPLIVEHKGTTQVITTGTNRIRGYDLKTGKVLWECGGMTINAIPSPVTANGVVYVMSGYKGSMAVAIPLDARGDVTDTAKVLWRHRRGTPYVPSPMLVDDRLYFTYVNQPVLTCLDVKTGKPVIDRERLPMLTSLYASPAGARGRIYITDREGTTLVIRQADKFEVLATNALGEPVDGSPVLVGRQLFLRGHEHLYCIAEK
jgi:outer membrane protein assembly factor BamB